MKKYEINDPWDWVTHFENEIANYTGYKYGIACDSNSNAIRLLLHYEKITNCDIEIPARTYVSVPNQIILSGNRPKFTSTKWWGPYRLGNTNIVDSATGFYEGISTEYEDCHMVLSFHFKKILNIGTGGMILTNDGKFEKWARPMIHDGRHKYTMYDDDQFECIGWHMYMTPEQAQRGLEIFHSDKIQKNNPEVIGGDDSYFDLRLQPIFSDYVEEDTIFHFGCSFTENFRWYNISDLFKERGLKYVNAGRSSANNFYIFNKFKQSAKNNSTAIIQWSSLTRPNDENSSLLKSSDNPLYDLLEQWYKLLDETKKIASEKNIKLIQYIGWATWKDEELNDYHRKKLNSYDIIWFESNETYDAIVSNCWQFQSPSEWTSSPNEDGLFKWSYLKWGGMSEWIRENVDINNRYLGMNEINIFDPHPTEYATIEFTKKILFPLLDK